MNITSIVAYEYDKDRRLYYPTMYPAEKRETMQVPKDISKDFHSLASMIEEKYTREYLKICAFYNKLFPSLKSYDWNRSSYNSMPFTIQDQERADTGTGIAANFMKTIIDTVVARIGNTKFEYRLVSDRPTAMYTVYKDEIERSLKAIVREENLNRMAVESFHDAAILSFSHAFMDPWTHKLRRINDWELGVYEAEFCSGRLKRVMIRDFAFPVSELRPYIGGFSEDYLAAKARQGASVDLRLFINCFTGKKYVAIGQDVGEESDYPFEEVLLSSLSWDIGTKRTTVSSLFDLLYPQQRSLNKVLAKKTQTLAAYKGPTPVFNQDADIVVKSISNGSGEALFLSSPRVDNPASVVGVINPTPLDPEMNAEAEAIKATMYELAGVQNASLDIENLRSAAQMISLDQFRDAAFQSQLSALAEHIREMAMLKVRYMATVKPEQQGMAIDWEEAYCMLECARLDIIPVHKLAIGTEGDAPAEPDYKRIHTARFIAGVVKGEKTFSDMDYSYDRESVFAEAAVKVVELKPIVGDAGEELERLEAFLLEAFVDEARRGAVTFAYSPNEKIPLPPPSQAEAQGAPVEEGAAG